MHTYKDTAAIRDDVEYDEDEHAEAFEVLQEAKAPTTDFNVDLIIQLIREETANSGREQALQEARMIAEQKAEHARDAEELGIDFEF